MENAADALKLAFYVILFVLALTLSITTFSKAKETSDIVIQLSDDSRYYEYEQITTGDIEENVVDEAGNRIVGLETIIPTLYKYDKERYRVEFYNASGNPLTIYQTKISTISNRAVYNTNRNTEIKNIYYFDIVDEEQRAEPWVGNSEQIKLHLDAILNGSKYHLPQYSADFTTYDPNYSGSNLSIANARNKRFREEIGRKTTTETDESQGKNKTTTKIIIKYTLLN